MREIIVLGGGLAGLVSAITLKRAGLNVLVIEKKRYPFHRVCGEYISNEVKDFLQRMNIFPERLGPASVTQLQLSAINGKIARVPLDLGGFGISRYQFDNFLYEEASALGVEFMLEKQVSMVKFRKDHFLIKIEGHADLQADVVVGSFGKRSRLDRSLNRSFLKRKSPFIGVKYHIRYNEHPENTIALHNFTNGYCGINKIEDGKYNLCYLSARSNLSNSKSIPDMEQNVLSKNPELAKIFSNAEFLFQKPEVINEISFETKGPIEEHVLMCGDAAGMITPLCGNGMAMAIQSAFVLSQEVIEYFKIHRCRHTLEKKYSQKWNALFRNRLWNGRTMQKIFGSELISNMAVEVMSRSKVIAAFLVKQTHGKPF